MYSICHNTFIFGLRKNSKWLIGIGLCLNVGVGWGCVCVCVCVCGGGGCVARAFPLICGRTRGMGKGGKPWERGWQRGVEISLFRSPTFHALSERNIYRRQQFYQSNFVTIISISSFPVSNQSNRLPKLRVSHSRPHSPFVSLSRLGLGTRKQRTLGTEDFQS